jgi:hypothetical protein
MTRGDLQAERQKLHHAAFIDVHDFAILRREHQRYWVAEVREAKKSARADFAI